MDLKSYLTQGKELAIQIYQIIGYDNIKKLKFYIYKKYILKYLHLTES